MIVVTGASGQLGRRIVHSLVKRVSPKQVVATCRDPAKASSLAALGVSVRRADFADPLTLPSAFEGATQVLIVSSDARRYGGDPQAQHRAAIQAAKQVRVKRILYTSHMAASATSLFPPMLEHAQTERMLAESGVAWTALRHGFYASSGALMLGDWERTGEVVAPADGAVSWTAHDDLASAAAAILTQDGAFEGPTPPLTGSEALDFERIAELLSQKAGRTVRRLVIDDDELRARLAARGVPAAALDIAVGYYRAARAGEFAAVDPTLERLLGRAPTRMSELL